MIIGMNIAPGLWIIANVSRNNTFDIQLFILNTIVKWEGGL